MTSNSVANHLADAGPVASLLRAPAATSARQADIDIARRDLATWLLSPAVALADESGAIGIVNWLDARLDEHDGLYPEIGGYYLLFLSQVASVDATDQVCRKLAQGVLRWFDRSGVDGAPATIERRCSRPSDWRNQCLFTFDLAMIVRGMLAVEQRWPDIVPGGLIGRYAAAAQAISHLGQLGSHRLRDGAAVIVPVKWSTQIDVHHVKAAAALEASDHAVSAIAARTLDRWRETERPPVRELHPALYLIEGWLIAWARTSDRADIARAAAMFAAVLELVDQETFDLPAVAGGPYAASRGDAQGQLLRAGLILERANALEPATAESWRSVRDGVVANVLARISSGGGVTFDRGCGHRNSWASMFAWQALELLRPDRLARPQDDAAHLI